MTCKAQVRKIRTICLKCYAGINCTTSIIIKFTIGYMQMNVGNNLFHKFQTESFTEVIEELNCK